MKPEKEKAKDSVVNFFEKLSTDVPIEHRENMMNTVLRILKLEEK